jgi:molecular chaperone HtpG
MLENMQDDELPVYITKPEFLRRWNDMQKMTGETGFYGMEMEKANININTNHPLVNAIVNETDETKAKNLSKQLVDLAMLSQQMLKGEALSDFINRSIEMMK